MTEPCSATRVEALRWDSLVLARFTGCGSKESSASVFASWYTALDRAGGGVLYVSGVDSEAEPRESNWDWTM